MQRQFHDHPGARAAMRCPVCGAGNRCAIAAGGAAASCWCMHAAPRHPLPAAPAAACYCPDCLTRLSAPAGGAR